MMNDKDYRIFSLFASLVQQRFPDSRIWAFGSRIKGRFIEDSDLDVCVVVDKLDDTVDQSIMDIAWQVGFEHDLLISTITYSQQEFERGPCFESTPVQNILKEGVEA